MVKFSIYEPTEAGFKDAYERLCNELNTGSYPSQKYLVKFRNPVTVVHNRKLQTKEKEVEMSFFIAANGHPCYSCRIHPRHGRYITYEMFENIDAIYLRTETDFDYGNQTKRLLGKFHRNLWTNIQQELIDDPSIMKTKYFNNFGTINISQKFPKVVLQQLKTAIENKENYSHKEYGEKRDLSIEAKLCDDGVYRAWYSSEFAGCGNGSYYLLINPTTAAFREDD